MRRFRSRFGRRSRFCATENEPGLFRARRIFRRVRRRLRLAGVGVRGGTLRYFARKTPVKNGLRRDSGGSCRRGGVYRDELYRAQLDNARVLLQARPYGDASGSEGKGARPENFVRRK